MPKSLSNDLSRSHAAFDQCSTLLAVIEMGLEGWLVAGVVPGLKRKLLIALRRLVKFGEVPGGLELRPA